MTRNNTPDARWTDDNYHRAYALAREGMSDLSIAKALGVTKARLALWVKRKPALGRAISDGRDGQKARESTEKKVLSKLSASSRELWHKIVSAEQMPVETESQREARQREEDYIFDGVGRLAAAEKQRLFLYAVMHCNFTKSEACRRLGINHVTLSNWEKTSPAYARLARELEEAKKDFYESALVSLVRQGDSHAVIFANRTYNRDRGYNDRVEVKMSGKVDTVAPADLPVEVRRMLLEALRARQAQAPALTDNSDVVDAEVVSPAGE